MVAGSLAQPRQWSFASYSSSAGTGRQLRAPRSGPWDSAASRGSRFSRPFGGWCCRRRHPGRRERRRGQGMPLQSGRTTWFHAPGL